jgi:tRNA(adenine34) deaminase
MMPNSHHEEFMRIALEEARLALGEDEVPVGAVIIHDGKVIARGHDLKEKLGDPTAHAEIMAIRRAAEMLNSWRLLGCEIYSTLEPCAMCVGAMLQARVSRLIYGAENVKFGAVETNARLLDIPCWNHKIAVISGVLREDCSALLKQYFRRKRG